MKLPGELLLYLHAYRVLDDLTPIAADCGRLCGSRCCKGDSETGMLLFPHEELLLSAAGYRLLPMSLGSRSVLMAVCEGRCDRRLRPLSCRIYPYAPVLRDGAVKVIPDPRAKPFCPLLLPEAAEYIQPAFTDTVREVFTEMAAKSRRIAGFLADYTAMLDGYAEFTNGLL